MLAVLAAVLFGIGFFLEALNQSQHYVWMFLLGGLFFLALGVAIVGGPAITIRRN